MEGKKYDNGKPLVGLMLHDFANALMAVAEVSTYSVNKYGSPSDWKYVPNGKERYANAKARHMIMQAIEKKDEESNLLHLAHEAWNALALLELELTKEQEPYDGFQEL